MSLQPAFHPFQTAIDGCFEKAKVDAGARVKEIGLLIEENPHGRGMSRAEFLVLEPVGPVRITWNGIASLWAFAQGAGRLSRRMFDGKRSGLKRLAIADDDELERGINCFELARRFCSQTPPPWASTIEHWPEWAPRIEPSAAAGSDNATGNHLFLGALGWIFRHELAHIALNHAVRQKNGDLSTVACETEADLEATRWFRGARRADPSRVAGATPSQIELELEWRAISLGLGLIWVALFEADRGQPNEDHPPPAERLAACLTELELREDSIAAEILYDVIHAWIDPEGDWAAPDGHRSARDALNEAVFRMHRLVMY